MDKMDMFNKDDNKYNSLNECIADRLLISTKEKLLMQLHHVCGQIAEYAVAVDTRDTIEVIPFLKDSCCAIRITVGVYKPIDIYIISESSFCDNSLLFMKDFVYGGIANASELIATLNSVFKGANFMLDIDTNEN